MIMNFAKFKKQASDKDATTLKHPDGHTITISHAALSPKMRKQLTSIPMEEEKMKKESKDSKVSGPANPKLAESKKMPAMADGGPSPTPPPKSDDTSTYQVGEPNSVGNTVTKWAQSLVPAKAEGGKVNGATCPHCGSKPAMALDDGTPDGPVAEAIPDAAPAQDAPAADTSAAPMQVEAYADPSTVGPPAPQPAAPPAPPAPDPFGVNATTQAFTTGENEYKLGLNNMAKAQGAQAQAEAATNRSEAAGQQQLQNNYTEALSDLTNEHDNFVKDYANGHIDPNQYFDQMGAGGKVSTAIGLILGGMGQGLMRSGSNPAMDFLNSQINRNIDAQKANLGKKATLLEANMRQFGNMKDATDMLSVQNRAIYSAKLKAAAATATAPMAAAQALQAAGKFDTENSQQLGQMAMRRTLLGGVSQGQVPPETLMRAGVVNKEQIPQFTKELQERDDTVAFRDRLLAAYDDLSKQDTIGNQVMHLGFTPPQVQQDMAVLGELSKGTAGKFTEADAHILTPLLRQRGLSDESKAAGRAKLVALASAKMHFPTLQEYGVPGSAPLPASSQSQIQFKPR